MSDDGKVAIGKLATGVPGLDEVLGGGLPELSFNLIAGSPGAGKTTLAHQIAFATATSRRPALYFSVLGEPPLKMLRYQQTYTFFDANKVNDSIRFIYFTQEVMAEGLDVVLEKIVREVEATEPALVIVDSFRAVVRAVASREASELALQGFVQRLALHLTAWEATTFLVGEFEQHETEANPVFTLADGLLWLSQATDRNSIVRKLQVIKVRGQAPIPGLHTFRISHDGLQVFPRLPKPDDIKAERAPTRRLSTGVSALDEMLGGGIPPGFAVLIAGPSGSGKTVLSTQFIVEGVKQGEPGIIAIFEKRPHQYLATARTPSELEQMIHDDKIKIVSMRPLDLSVDEALYELRQAVLSRGAKRVVIDSLSGFELALAPAFREDFRESLYRMVGALTGLGITVMLTAEMVDSYVDLKFSPQDVSFLSDCIILQRYIELNGQLKKIMAIVKLRGSEHSKEIRAYEITENGLVVGEALTDYRDLLIGVPRKNDPTEESATSKPNKTIRN
jgi:circadian clock protein KaiC